jgi:hypothetical protein
MVANENVFVATFSADTSALLFLPPAYVLGVL